MSGGKESEVTREFTWDSKTLPLSPKKSSGTKWTQWESELRAFSLTESDRREIERDDGKGEDLEEEEEEEREEGDPRGEGKIMESASSHKCLAKKVRRYSVERKRGNVRKKVVSKSKSTPRGSSRREQRDAAEAFFTFSRPSSSWKHNSPDAYRGNSDESNDFGISGSFFSEPTRALIEDCLFILPP
jgi:hypothetical protein